ncbi:S-adenosylmethionine decarboxylase family protein [Pseudooceanicola sp. MF1-13]|uniref:S-adenosylmethionine decarboxylase family protein n=1 Tax=Pseudooceanicola sp. MF1-13 TaxID=3379095 RepID=UPI00389123A3
MSDFSPGTQLLIDHRGGKGMNDPALLEAAIRDAVLAQDLDIVAATITKAPGRDGVTGAVILSEGIVAVHSWADQNYASFDVLAPGEGVAKKIADALARALLPDWTQIKAQKRNDFTPLPPAT